MKFRKIIKAFAFTTLTLTLIGLILVRKCTWLSDISEIGVGFIIPLCINSYIDCSDLFKWQISLRKHLRGKLLSKNDYIRISFAYLFRLQYGNQYLLVRSARGTEKYQPIGGAYKFKQEEKEYLARHFCIRNDDKIPFDNNSKDDYRLFVPAKYLKKFVKRFDKTEWRENISDLSREFKEEVVSKGILDFSSIAYRYCGRHISNIEYSRYFNCYELLIADIVEVILSEKQENDLKRLMRSSSDEYMFATEDEINACGIKAGTDKLLENIADHSFKILQSTENQLINRHGSEKYIVSLS